MFESRDIVGYEGLYRVTENGEVISLRRFRKRFLNPVLMSIGYFKVSLGKSNQIYVHRLVAEAFVSNPDCKPQVNHIDGNRSNNNFSNLEWTTQSENNIHALRTGLRKTKITRNDALKIKYGHKGLNGVEVARIYGVTKTFVYQIRGGLTWKHI